MRCLPRFVQPGVSFVEHPHPVRSVCLTRSLGTQASRLARRGQRAALVACRHGCRRDARAPRVASPCRIMCNLQAALYERRPCC
jgi:hypothetical protein